MTRLLHLVVGGYLLIAIMAALAVGAVIVAPLVLVIELAMLGRRWV